MRFRRLSTRRTPPSRHTRPAPCLFGSVSAPSPNCLPKHIYPDTLSPSPTNETNKSLVSTILIIPFFAFHSFVVFFLLPGSTTPRPAPPRAPRTLHPNAPPSSHSLPFHPHAAPRLRHRPRDLPQPAQAVHAGRGDPVPRLPAPDGQLH